MGFLVRLLAVIGVIAILVVIAGAIYLFAGFYDVAADAQEPDVVSSALVSVRQASVARHAAGLTPPVSMSDNSVIQSGARGWRLSTSGGARSPESIRREPLKCPADECAIERSNV